MVDLQHYVQILKKHEETRASTNERNEYWKKYAEQTTQSKSALSAIPKSAARFEHG
jgi:hypothetical protein